MGALRDLHGLHITAPAPSRILLHFGFSASSSYQQCCNAPPEDAPGCCNTPSEMHRRARSRWQRRIWCTGDAAIHPQRVRPHERCCNAPSTHWDGPSERSRFGLIRLRARRPVMHGAKLAHWLGGSLGAARTSSARRAAAVRRERERENEQHEQLEQHNGTSGMAARSLSASSASSTAARAARRAERRAARAERRKIRAEAVEIVDQLDELHEQRRASRAERRAARAAAELDPARAERRSIRAETAAIALERRDPLATRAPSTHLSDGGPQKRARLAIDEKKNKKNNADPSSKPKMAFIPPTAWQQRELAGRTAAADGRRAGAEPLAEAEQVAEVNLRAERLQQMVRAASSKAEPLAEAEQFAEAKPLAKKPEPVVLTSKVAAPAVPVVRPVAKNSVPVVRPVAKPSSHAAPPQPTAPMTPRAPITPFVARPMVATAPFVAKAMTSKPTLFAVPQRLPPQAEQSKERMPSTPPRRGRAAETVPPAKQRPLLALRCAGEPKPPVDPPPWLTRPQPKDDADYDEDPHEFDDAADAQDPEQLRDEVSAEQMAALATTFFPIHPREGESR